VSRTASAPFATELTPPDGDGRLLDPAVGLDLFAELDFVDEFDFVDFDRRAELGRLAVERFLV